MEGVRYHQERTKRAQEGTGNPVHDTTSKLRRAQESPGKHQETGKPGRAREGTKTIRPSRIPTIAIHAKLLSIQALQDSWANINGTWATDG